MTFQSFLSSIGLSEVSFWGILAFLASLWIEKSPKVKWNPWTSLIKWIGEKFNSHIDAKMDAVKSELKEDIDGLTTKIDSINTDLSGVRTDLDTHIADSRMKSLEDTRKDILDFANACMNNRKHTKEQYEYMVDQCDKYETYIKENNIKNGVIEEAIGEIRRLYHERRRKNDFLKEGEDPEEYIKRSILEEVVKELHKLVNEARPASRARKKTVKKEEGESENECTGTD